MSEIHKNHLKVADKKNKQNCLFLFYNTLKVTERWLN